MWNGSKGNLKSGISHHQNNHGATSADWDTETVQEYC